MCVCTQQIKENLLFLCFLYLYIINDIFWLNFSLKNQPIYDLCMAICVLTLNIIYAVYCLVHRRLITFLFCRELIVITINSFLMYPTLCMILFIIPNYSACNFINIFVYTILMCPLHIRQR